MIFSKTALLAMTLLVLTGCVTDTGKASGSGDGMANFDGTYRLVDIDGKAIPGNAVLNIDGQSMFGQAPCNSYTSQNNATWPQVSLAGIASTRRACITEGGESAYFAALEQVAQASLSDGDLELRGPAHKMRFTAE